MKNGDTKMRARRRNANIAYACYLWIAFVLVVAKSLDWLLGNPQTPAELSTLQGIGMLVILPLSLAAIIAAIFGMESSLKLWSYWRRETGLLILPVLLFILFAAFVLTETDALASIWLAMFAVIYAVAAIAFSLHWFLFARKQFGTQH